MMSSLQPRDDLLPPVQQENSKAFAIMAVPDQKANSFLCQHRQLPEASPDLKPADAKYGAYYLSASRLNYGEEESPALLLVVLRQRATKSNHGVPITRNTSRQKTVVSRPSR